MKNTKAQNIRAVLFDVDGTLIDSVDQHTKAWQETFAHFNLDIPFDKIRNEIGKGSEKLIQTLAGEEFWNKHGKEASEFRKDLFAKKYLPHLKAFPCVRELFERVRDSGRKIALATSAVGEELETYLKLTNVKDLVQAQTSADDVKESKPSPDIFQAALDRLKLRGDEAVVVGDTRFDAEAAIKAGATPIGVLCGGFPEEQLRSAGCVEIYRDPADLLQRFNQSLLLPDRQ